MRIPSKAWLLSFALGAFALLVPLTASADTASCDGGVADGACDAALEPCTCDDCDGKIPVCGGCTSDGACNSDDACTCPECDADPICSTQCDFDGFCNQFSEGCNCDDCKSVTNCADNGTGGGGGAGGGGVGGGATGGSGNGGSTSDGGGGSGSGGSDGGGGSGGSGSGGCGCRTAGGETGSLGLLGIAALGAVVGLRRRRRG